jgi:hypothetical protein
LSMSAVTPRPVSWYLRLHKSSDLGGSGCSDDFTFYYFIPIKVLRLSHPLLHRCRPLPSSASTSSHSPPSKPAKNGNPHPPHPHLPPRSPNSPLRRPHHFLRHPLCQHQRPRNPTSNPLLPPQPPLPVQRHPPPIPLTLASRLILPHHTRRHRLYARGPQFPTHRFRRRNAHPRTRTRYFYARPRERRGSGGRDYFVTSQQFTKIVHRN